MKSIKEENKPKIKSSKGSEDSSKRNLIEKAKNMFWMKRTISLTQSAEMNIEWVRLPLRQWPKVDLLQSNRWWKQNSRGNRSFESYPQKKKKKTIPKFMDSCIKAFLIILYTSEVIV